jgi:predicted dehydrogenase
MNTVRGAARMVRIGIVGLGYWGPNLVRSFALLPDTEVVAVCDLHPARLEAIRALHPGVRTVESADELFQTPGLDAVVIATPTSTHYDLARRALERGLHVFVEKPLAESAEECRHLAELARRQGRTLFVGHVFLYTPAIRALKEIVDDGELGPLACITAARRNFGPIRTDVNALWDLAPHDISIILFLLGAHPVSVRCQGLARLRGDVHDVCHLTMHFEGDLTATIHCSWLDPVKIRQMTLVGGRRMALFDDMEPVEKVRVYDRGIDIPAAPSLSGEEFSYRIGETRVPVLEDVEPLLVECRHFVDCVRSGTAPRTGGANGLEVVRVLEAADESLRADGARVPVVSDPERILITAVA